MQQLATWCCPACNVVDQSREAGVLLWPSHSPHYLQLALQASEPGTSDGVLPADDRMHGLCSASQPATQAPSLHEPGFWRTFLLRFLSIGIPVCFPSMGLPSLWDQEWARDFPFLHQWTLVSLPHMLPKEQCCAVYGCAVGVSASSVGTRRQGAHFLFYPRRAVLWWVRYSHFRFL